MAKIATDRTTIDLFAQEKRPGRPKTNPLPREEQLRLNKRNQVKRDRSKGLKRIEFKLSDQLYSALEQQADKAGLTRSAYIESILTQVLTR
ncbi:LexA regulated protein [Rheinheimera muenzenbergensis]|uniref:LexA regulated protein n=1 Tax=Rheinheimera muenzenbergensis TaxID=1193628 RepID=A0ABU8CAW9_9GAMM|nr:LexA regulated protein [Gammaproteobacteria bacterium]MBU2072605.1 LexA regulated protein [Gammaproteobacteria bacterium]MBU2182261.1 LexA regulated protein [Gammaproteobacteria bacterium]MBU2207159.1 LexA regulated protein [Gammaproteobacteria bacterium]